MIEQTKIKNFRYVNYFQSYLIIYLARLDFAISWKLKHAPSIQCLKNLKILKKVQKSYNCFRYLLDIKNAFNNLKYETNDD